MRYVTLTWFLAVVLIGVGLSVLSRRGTLAPVESVVGDLFSPLQGGLRSMFSPLTDFLTGVGSYRELRDENQALREENERLNAELVRLRELQQRERSVAELTEVEQERSELQFLIAEVIGADASNQRQLIAVDRGEEHGVREGMVIVAAGGSLVGRVTKVLRDYSWVTLIADPHSTVNAEIQESGARGVVSGRPGNGLIMELVPEGSPVQVGDKVVTSGLGGNFPKTLYIGLVASVESSSQELFLRLSVEPAVRLNRLKNVLIVTNFLPVALEEAE